MVTLKVNGEQHDLDIEAEMPLLWALRNEIGLTGTKYGCGIAQCGACTVLMDGQPVRSCSLPVSGAQGHEITTIEGPFQGRQPEQGAAGLDRGRRAAMRLLPVRPDHVGHRAS